MLTAAAVCPHPPLLIPEVAAGAADELDELRAACGEAVGRLSRSDPDVLAVVGVAAETGDFGLDPAGSMRPYGLELTIGPAEAEPTLPLSLTIGRWLLERAARTATGRPWTGTTVWHGVAADESPAACADLGRRIASLAPSVAMLCMGDGSCYRGTKAPGYTDPRAEGFDVAVAAALAEADARALAGLSPDLAAALTAAGRPAWQVLAGAADGHPFTGELLADQAPYGVRYYVAAWSAA